MAPAASAPPYADFPPQTPEQWAEAARKLLKGEDPAALAQPTAEPGLAMQPLYAERPATPPLALPSPRSWRIQHDHIFTRDEVLAIPLEEYYEHEVGAVGLNMAYNRFAKPDYGFVFWAALLGEDLIEDFAWHFELPCNKSLRMLRAFHQYLIEVQTDPWQLPGAAVADPYTEAAYTGKLAQGWQQQLGKIATFLCEELPRFRLAGADAIFWRECGATPVQELAWSLATSHDQILALQAAGIPPEKIACGFRWQFSVGGHLLLEVAKLRAARLLWARLLAAHKLPSKEATLQVHATTAYHTKSPRAPYTNLIRSAIESLAGILGGADSILTLRHDILTEDPSAYSRGLARNAQLLARHESFLSAVADPLAGAYAIENLTHSLVEAAWARYEQTMHEGGMPALLQSGALQSALKENLAQRQAALQAGAQVFLGENKYPDPDAPEEVVLHPNFRFQPGEEGDFASIAPVQDFQLLKPAER